jgi:hypothetical protein
VAISGSSAHSALPGLDQDPAGAQHEGEHEQQRGRHPVGGGQRGQRTAHGGQAGQNREEQLDPVENVRQNAGHQGEQDCGQSVGGLHEGNEYGRVSVMDQQPLGTHGLHPLAQVADERRDPQRPEQPDAQRCPGGRSRSRVSHAVSKLPVAPPRPR